MKTKTYTVYKFSELPEESKQKALENYRGDMNLDYEWWQDDALLDIPGATWKKIYFDLDRGQFLQFEGLDIPKSEEFRELLKLSEALWKKVSYNFSNSRNSSSEIDFIYVDDVNLTDRELRILEDAEEIFSDKVHQAWKNLRDEYEYRMSNKAVIETFEANDYDFTLEGKIDK